MRLYGPLIVITATVAIAITVFGVMAVLATPVEEHPFFAPVTQINNPEIIAYRGGSKLWPENTLYAFEQAKTLGVDILEMDVRLSADGAMVLMHDSSVDRTTNGTGAVAQLTAAELQSLDAAYHWSDDHGQTYRYRGHGITVPIMAEVLSTFPEMRKSIKMQTPERVLSRTLCALIYTHAQMDRILVTSINEVSLQDFREMCPSVATSASNKEVRSFFALNMAFLVPIYNPAFHALQVPIQRNGIQVITAGFVRAAHERGIKVHVHKTNEDSEVQLMRKLGVDGFVTDDPDLLLTFLGRH